MTDLVKSKLIYLQFTNLPSFDHFINRLIKIDNANNDRELRAECRELRAEGRALRTEGRALSPFDCPSSPGFLCEVPKIYAVYEP